jgi:hypothetical protein
MSTTTTTTTTTVATAATVDYDQNDQNDQNDQQPFSFEQAIEKVGELMLDMYADPDVAQQVAVAAQNVTKTVMEPIYAAFLEELDAREQKINDLMRLIEEARKASEPQLKDLKVPTLKWVIENHKGKGEKLNAYNMFCMVFRSLFNRFPQDGEWKGLSQADQEPWKVLASEYNAYRMAMKNAVPTIINPFVAPAPVAPVAPVAAPVAASVPVVQSKALSAYQLWLEEWRLTNKGQGVAPSGKWKSLPADEKAAIEKKFAALKASRLAQHA